MKSTSTCKHDMNSVDKVSAMTPFQVFSYFHIAFDIETVYLLISILILHEKIVIQFDLGNR